MVVTLVQHECRDADHGQDIAHVRLHRHPRNRHGGARAGGQSLELGEPLPVVRVIPSRTGELVEEQHAAAPVALKVFEPYGLSEVGRPRIGRAVVTAAGERAVCDDRSRSLRVCGSEQERYLAGLGQAHDRGLIRSHGVHQAGDVVDAVFEQGGALIGRPIRHPRASLVERDQARERSQSSKESSHLRVFPGVLHV